MEETLPLETFEKYFSCFSGHMLEIEGVLYTTLEHAYHASRYTDPKIIEEIVSARSALLAWKVSQMYKDKQIPNWDQVKPEVMERLFRAKLEQHADVRSALIASGDALILKHQPSDSFWGDGPDGSGRNEMGKIWMKLRAELIS